MKQYLGVKAKYPDAVLLFRVGDFYETFSSDAEIASKVLGIVLTKRKNGSASEVALAGFPHHAMDTYLPKLVKAGYRVAICDQLENPKNVKGIVKRGVTELVTPGVALNEKLIENKTNNFLAAIHFDKSQAGISFLDITTGEFYLAEGTIDYIKKLVGGFKPSEILYQKQKHADFDEAFDNKTYSFRLEDWAFTEDFGREKLLNHFGVKSLKGFGVERYTSGIIAAGAILHYLGETRHEKLSHISAITRIEEDKHVWLDHFTIRNLELVAPTSANGVSLIDVIDQTQTPMGSRLLKKWLLLPLREINQIKSRIAAVEHFVKEESTRIQLAEKLQEMGDLERIISKVATGRVTPRELVQLKEGLQLVTPIKELLAKTGNEMLMRLADQLNPCSLLIEKIDKEVNDDAPANFKTGGFISDGINHELDELREIAFHGKDYLKKLQRRESERTGIASLKVAYNNVFGYYLEVRNTHKDKVPEEWIRKQTLVNAERYITEELKEYESKILGAQEKIDVLESEIFQALVSTCISYLQPIQIDAQVIASLDCLHGFSKLTLDKNYCKPEVEDSQVLEIKEGRHPVIEAHLSIDETYVPNDVLLDSDSQQIMMVTGPNMSGKSALLRQTALIVLMAQIGCYVPATAAKIGVVDKVFTRVGASDNISSGESTFMVEMNETASILNNVTPNSLILLDEIGRGTSTFDGISIAWAIAEYLHEVPKANARTLFATHYHELNNMAATYARIKNYNVSVKEIKGKIIFLRKLQPGGSNHSFGIHVAKIAGMPKRVLDKADNILASLEANHGKEKLSDSIQQVVDNDMQLSFFSLDDPTLEQVRDEIKNLDINTLTPVEALMKLHEIKKVIGLN